MNKSILETEAQNFIKIHINEYAIDLILSGSPFLDIDIKELVAQIVAKQKCKKKLPTWFETSNIYYPNKINIEQTSSEITANYKATLIKGGVCLIDLTGGFGVDSYAFSFKFNKVIHCEVDTELSNIAAFNFKTLQRLNIDAINKDGLAYLKQANKNFDWIFIDPSRRSLNNKKVFLLNQCTPDITLHLDLFFKYSNNILIKLSPLLDLTKTIKDLKYVKEIHCVALNNEVKETLYILEKDYKDSTKIRSINIAKKESQIFDYIYNKPCKLNCKFISDYLYEPNAAIMKTGGFNQLAKQYGVYKLHANTNLFTSKELIDFPGRRFKVIEEFGYNKRKIKEVLPKGKANISARNFPDYPAQLHKKLKIKSGGSEYLFFVTDKEERHRVVLCHKV